MQVSRSDELMKQAIVRNLGRIAMISVKFLEISISSSMKHLQRIKFVNSMQKAVMFGANFRTHTFFSRKEDL
jgi:hypothetical protein